MRRMGRAEIDRRIDTKHRRAVERAIAAHDWSRPHHDLAALLQAAAVGFATDLLTSTGLPLGSDPLGRLADLLALDLGGRRCACGCGRPAVRMWATDACRKRAARAARASRATPSVGGPGRS
jgi:hypothetical protein